MGRITRKKAAEVAESLHIDEDAVLELGDDDENMSVPKAAKELHLELVDREPLGELEANSVESKSQSDDGTQDLKKSTRGKKGGKKGAKGKKNNLAASTASQLDIPEIFTDHQEVMPDENDSPPSPASEKAAEDLLKDIRASLTPVDNTKPSEYQTKAVKLTRNQLAKIAVEPKSLLDGIGQTPEEQETMKEELVSIETEESPAINTSTISEDKTGEIEPATQLGIDAPASPLPNAVPTVLARLRADTPAKRTMSNKENVEPSPDLTSPLPTPSMATPDLATPGPSSSRPADAIAALDELEEAVESVNKDIPDVQTSPEKPKVKRETKKATPVVRGTKASQARISLAQNPDLVSKPPTLGQPKPSATIGRSNSARQSLTANPQAAMKRAPSGTATKANKAATDGEKKEVVIPHSKPRPVSLSFPTPPPPAKSTKAPTQSTFQLSGEAVAAKLKAAREARMHKEGEEQQKPTFKARPVPSSISKAPSVRQTTASKARESIMTGKDPKTSTVPANGAQKRVGSTATKPPSAHTVSKTTSKPPPISSKPASGDLAVRKRPSTTLANTSKPRTSVTTATGPNLSAPRTTSNTTKGTVRGKEVFNRPAAAKAAAEKQKQEKEAAAKKARAEAAERGRLASREWAEKQKKIAASKKTGNAKDANGKVPTEVVQEEQTVTEQSAPQLVEAETAETAETAKTAEIAETPVAEAVEVS